MKEALLTQMEGHAVAEEKLIEHSSNPKQAAMRKRVAEVDAGIAELRKVLEAEEKETAAIAGSLRRQVEQYKAELKAMGGERAKLERLAAERKQKEAERGERGLMGEVARRQEAKLEEARTRSREAKARAEVHRLVMLREVTAAEETAAAATKARPLAADAQSGLAVVVPSAAELPGSADTGAGVIPASLRGMISPPPPPPADTAPASPSGRSAGAGSASSATNSSTAVAVVAPVDTTTGVE